MSPVSQGGGAVACDVTSQTMERQMTLAALGQLGFPPGCSVAWRGRLAGTR